jgi:hypothetical protein
MEGKIQIGLRMKSYNNIYSFFIALALLFWNPISYFLIYADTDIYSKVIHNFYCIVFISGVVSVLWRFLDLWLGSQC